MNELIIEKSAKTPFINFDAQSGILKIIGRSIPENPEEFYTNLFIWTKEYFNKPQNETLVHVQLEYINSGSSKFILEFFQLIQLYKGKGMNCKINWHYEEDDEAVLELGKHYQSIIDVPFKLIELY
ncbi:MAG: DUF1987 domain-containing protein [Bacteroidales bacterium]|jgi:hypothetical protein|nr:DUF1987 domain-containing protein [Bacteroidales bacterium]